jgi:hypothetical protein
MPELPAKRYLRRGDIIAYFGIDGRDFTKLVSAGVLTAVYLQGRGRAFYRREEVVAAERDNRIFRTQKA